MPDPTILTVAEEFRGALLAREAAATGRLINAYREIATNLAGRIDALILAIQSQPEATAAQIRRLDQYINLIQDATVQLTRYSGFAHIEMTEAARQAVDMGARHSLELANLSAGSSGVVASLQRLPASAIETLLGFLSPEGPLFERLGNLPGVTATRMSEAILEGVALGRNPKVIARYIHNNLGMGLTDSMRMMRTVQIYSYREAARANYVANSDVVRGWVWYARLDNPTTCMSCIAMHGTEHPNEEPLNDHHNGFCMALPLIEGRESPVTESGEEWFGKQDEAAQRERMGAGKHTAWKDGAFGFDALTGIHEDEVYGPMRIEQSLRALTGG